MGAVQACAAELRRVRNCQRPKRTPKAIVTARKARRSRPRELSLWPMVQKRVAPPTPSVAMMQKILQAMPALRAQSQRKTMPRPMPTIARSQRRGNKRPNGSGRGVRRNRAMVPTTTNKAPANRVQKGSFFIGAARLKVAHRGEGPAQVSRTEVNNYF